MDKQFRAQMLLNDDDWGKFIMQVLLKAEVPPQFPLQNFTRASSRSSLC
jgi:hypothetical protein